MLMAVWGIFVIIDWRWGDWEMREKSWPQESSASSSLNSLLCVVRVSGKRHSQICWKGAKASMRVSGEEKVHKCLKIRIDVRTGEKNFYQENYMMISQRWFDLLLKISTCFSNVKSILLTDLWLREKKFNTFLGKIGLTNIGVSTQ